MTILDPVSLEVLLGAMVSVEDRLQAVAQAHGQGMIERLQAHYQHPVDLGAEPYVPFLVSTYALQFYKTLNRMGKIGKKQPKARRRGKKAVGFAFPVRGGHILVKAFDPNKDLAPQLQRRIALEQARMEERFKQGLDGYRQETLGIEQYIWRTMDDGKVRALHRQYDDRRFSWDNPPADGHPGDAFGCRCTAEPVLPDILPLDPDPPEIFDEDWAALAQEVALTLALTVLAAYTGGAATPLLLARAARLASRMRGAYRVAGRLMEKIKDPTAREGFKQRQASLQKAIEKVEQRIKEVEDRIRAAEPKNLGGKTDKEIRDIAEKIAKGHAWEKHKNEYPEIKTKEDLQKFVEEIMKKADDIKEGERDRTAYWHNDSGSIVIHDPNHVDQGTIFKPDTGKDYFDNDFN
jgi:SPP1 gp7 family putative phage head morphogenesis protein